MKYILPARWLPLEYRTEGETKQEKAINEVLEDLKSTIKHNYADFIYRGEAITASKLKNRLFSLDERKSGIMELFDIFLADCVKVTAKRAFSVTGLHAPGWRSSFGTRSNARNTP